MIGWHGVPIHDACAVAYLIDPSLFTMKKMSVQIDLDGEYTMGSTVGDFYNVEGKEANVLVGFHQTENGLSNFIRSMPKL